MRDRKYFLLTFGVILLAAILFERKFGILFENDNKININDEIIALSNHLKVLFPEIKRF